MIKDIAGYEGFYKVTDDGRVWSCRRNKFLRQILTNTGYLRVSLSVNGKYKKVAVHRLVAETFVENPQNKPTVNHINEIKTDNRVENLEWATNLEQNIHGTRLQRARENTNYKTRKIDYKRVASKHDYVALAKLNSKPIRQIDFCGNVICVFKSLKDAAENTKVSKSKICLCAKGDRKSAGGFRWEYIS